jgi:Helix-turn-helix domain
MDASRFLQDVLEKPSVPVWPHTGWAFGLSRNAVYAAVQRGEIPAIRIGKRLTVPTSYLREILKLPPITPPAA